MSKSLAGLVGLFLGVDGITPATQVVALGERRRWVAYELPPTDENYYSLAPVASSFKTAPLNWVHWNDSLTDREWWTAYCPENGVIYLYIPS